MRAQLSFKITAATGATLTVLGILAAYLLEVVSDTLSTAWQLMEGAAFGFPIVGLICLYIGLIGLARRTPASRSTALGIVLLIPLPLIMLLSTFITNLINVHDWTMMPVIMFLLLLPLGLTLLIMGEIRRRRAV